MTRFYTEVLDFRISDQGEGRHGRLVFLSRDPEEHHQIVLGSGRDADSMSTVNQLSLRAETLADVRAAHDRAVAAGVADIRPIDHGIALSAYFPDPEDNRIEVYYTTPWYILQPHAQPLDFALSDAEILRNCEAKCRADPSFRPMEEWKAAFAAG